MLPIIFSLGSFKLYTFGFLLAIGFFLLSFIFWRRLKELGFEEGKTLDLVINFGFWGLIFSRFFYVVSHYQDYLSQISRVFLIGRYPGLSFWGFMVGFVIALYFFTRRHKWSFFKIGDEVVFAFLPFLLLYQVGAFFDGSFLGRPTSALWGIYVPGDLLRRQPVSLFYCLWLFVVWLFLLWEEREWQIWKWYKSKAEGFIFLNFLGFLLIGNLGLAFLKDERVYFLTLELVLSLFGLGVTLLTLYRRSGKKIYGQVKTKKN